MWCIITWENVGILKLVLQKEPWLIFSPAGGATSGFIYLCKTWWSLNHRQHIHALHVFMALRTSIRIPYIGKTMFIQNQNRFIRSYYRPGRPLLRPIWSLSQRPPATLLTPVSAVRSCWPGLACPFLSDPDTNRRVGCGARRDRWNHVWLINSAHVDINTMNTLYWNGQLVWTPAVGLYLCVFLCVDPHHVERRVT